MNLPPDYLEKVYIKNIQEERIDEKAISEVENIRSRKFKVLSPGLANIINYIKPPKKKPRKNQSSIRKWGSTRPTEIYQDIFSKDKFAGCDNVYTMKWQDLKHFHTLAGYLAKFGMRPVHVQEDPEKFKSSANFETLVRGRVVEGGDSENLYDDDQIIVPKNNRDFDPQEETVEERLEKEESVFMEITDQKNYMDLSAAELIKLLEEKDRRMAVLDIEIASLLEINDVLTQRLNEEAKDNAKEAEGEVDVNVDKEEEEEVEVDPRKLRMEKKLHGIYNQWVLIMKNEHIPLEEARTKLKYKIEMVAKCYLTFCNQLEKEERKIFKVSLKKQQAHQAHMNSTRIKHD